MSQAKQKSKVPILFRLIDSERDAKQVFWCALSLLSLFSLLDMSVRLTLIGAIHSPFFYVLLFAILLMRWQRYALAIALFVWTFGLFIGSLSFFRDFSFLKGVNPFYAFLILALSYRIFQAVQFMIELEFEEDDPIDRF